MITAEEQKEACTCGGEEYHEWNEKTCPPRVQTLCTCDIGDATGDIGHFVGCPVMPSKVQAMCTCGPLSEDKKKEIDDNWRDSWREVFRGFYSEQEKGSAAWLVSPKTVENFIAGLLEHYTN